MNADNNKMNKLDILKEVLFMLLKIAAFFVYWCFTLAVFSLIFVNVWRVTWEQLLTLAIVLTVLTTLVHIVGRLRKRK